MVTILAKKKNKLFDLPAFYYLHEAEDKPLDLVDAASRLDKNGVGFYITRKVTSFARTVAALEESTQLCMWNFLRFHGYVDLNSHLIFYNDFFFFKGVR